MKPTKGQLTEINKRYSIQNKDSIVILCEGGSETKNGYCGRFMFEYKQGHHKKRLKINTE